MRKYICIGILLAGDSFSLFPFHSIVSVLFSFIPAAFPAAVVGTSSITDYTTTSGCPGDLLSFVCLATNTSLLRWLFGENGEGIPFKSLDSVPYQRQLTIKGVTIRADLTNKICNSSTFCSLMKSQILIPISQDQVNLTCQSDGEEMDSVLITTNGM